MTIKVFNATELLLAARTQQSPIIKITPKKGDKKYKAGTTYLDVKLNVGGQLYDVWISAGDVPLCRDIADPTNKLDKRNDFEGTRLQYQMRVSECGDFGELMVLLNDQYLAATTALIADGTVKLGGKPHRPLITTHLSDNNAANPGGKIEDPFIKVKHSTKTYNDKFPVKELQNQPETSIFDYNSQYLAKRTVKKVVNGVMTEVEDEYVAYHPAMVDSGKVDASGAPVMELVTDKNLHKFVTENSVFRSLRISGSSIAIAGSGMSWPLTVNRAVIEPGVSGGFSDDVVDEEKQESIAAALRKLAQVPKPPAENAAKSDNHVSDGSSTTTTTTTAGIDVVSELLDDITI